MFPGRYQNSLKIEREPKFVHMFYVEKEKEGSAVR